MLVPVCLDRELLTPLQDPTDPCRVVQRLTLFLVVGAGHFDSLRRLDKP